MGHVIDLSVGGHGGGGGEGPAGAAPSLVSDAGDDSLLPPVHLGWQVLQSDLPPGHGKVGAGLELPGVEVATGVGLDKLLPANISMKNFPFSYGWSSYLERSANLVMPSFQLWLSALCFSILSRLALK